MPARAARLIRSLPHEGAGRKGTFVYRLLLLQALEVREGLLQRLDPAAVLGEVAGLEGVLGGVELLVGARDEIARLGAQAAACLPPARRRRSSPPVVPPEALPRSKPSPKAATSASPSVGSMATTCLALPSPPASAGAR